ncbi:hypothetical protein JZ751_004961 [Albula glossodonta]|uniref:Uncharacterized protein n=1 Tax=Albula glossodonta TaxID=121402 RepID=A0A8T2P4F3_9TELE|nr:hypothetical protein JZ751_004961 [Albula glossodonta]
MASQEVQVYLVAKEREAHQAKLELAHQALQAPLGPAGLPAAQVLQESGAHLAHLATATHPSV